MKKTILTACILFAAMGLKAQSFIQIPKQSATVRSIGNVLVIDSSYHNIDTLYSTSGDSKTLYRTLRSRFVTYDNLVCLYCVKEILIDNKAWRFYSMTIQPYINKSDYPGIILNNNLFTPISHY